MTAGRSGSSGSQLRGTVTRDGDGWVAYLRLKDPPGPLTHHHRWALRHRGGSAGRYRRDVGRR
jgi:hypothetical protein